MRVLVITTDYYGFLSQLYSAKPDLSRANYAEQLAAREACLFNVASFYAENFVAHGHAAVALYPNNFNLQAAWAREHGIDVPENSVRSVEDSNLVAWLKRRLRRYKALLGPLALHMSSIGPLGEFEKKVLLAQVEDYQPDLILNQDIQAVDGLVVRAMRKPGRIIIAQLGVDPPPGFDPGAYDLAISHIPWVVDFFQRKGLKAERQQLCFEPTVLDRLGPAPKKDVDVSFVGALTPAHASRVKLLEEVGRHHNLALWVPSLKGIPSSSPLHACRRGAVYGRDMYNVLRRSRITLNSHIDVARGSAGNMRLFEATGMGTFLLTDNLGDLPELFEPGKEVGTYDSSNDCIEKIHYYLAKEEERDAIAAAGQARTLREHTYYLRVEEILSFISRCDRN